MAPKRYNLSGARPQPPIAGPKLSPFKDRYQRVEFVDLLSLHQDEYSGSGGHAHVFKVVIKGNQYALKVFKFHDIEDARAYDFPFHNHKVKDRTMEFQSDPFFAECRAYGRIQEIQERKQAKAKQKKIADIAVPCYGFMILSSATYEEMLHTRFKITDWNRPEPDLQIPMKRRAPLRAIVKKLVENQEAIIKPGKMLRDLKALRQDGVYQRDVFVRNYLGGLLVDFSIAWTAPHWCLEVLGSANLEIRKDQELNDFDEMIETQDIKTTVRATKNWAKIHKLRSWDGAELSESGL